MTEITAKVDIYYNGTKRKGTTLDVPEKYAKLFVLTGKATYATRAMTPVVEEEEVVLTADQSVALEPEEENKPRRKYRRRDMNADG